MRSTANLAVQPETKRPETPMTKLVGLTSFLLGLVLIIASMVRGLLVWIGTSGSEHYSGILALTGLLLIGIGAHCLDLMERNERNLRG
jgi:hypothetical protein